MEITIICSIVFILIWIIIKPILLLLIDEENKKDIHRDSRKGSFYEISHRKDKI